MTFLHIMNAPSAVIKSRHLLQSIFVGAFCRRSISIFHKVTVYVCNADLYTLSHTRTHKLDRCCSKVANDHRSNWFYYCWFGVRQIECHHHSLLHTFLSVEGKRNEFSVKKPIFMHNLPVFVHHFFNSRKKQKQKTTMDFHVAKRLCLEPAPNVQATGFDVCSNISPLVFSLRSCKMH